MTDFTATARPVSAGLSGWIAALRAGIALHMARRAKYRQIYTELSGLTDRELGELGFSRADIAGVAQEAADRV